MSIANDMRTTLEFIRHAGDYVCEDCPECRGTGYYDLDYTHVCENCRGRGLIEFGCNDWIEFNGIPVHDIESITLEERTEAGFAIANDHR